jgi:hypothetical protein
MVGGSSPCFCPSYMNNFIHLIINLYIYIYHLHILHDCPHGLLVDCHSCPWAQCVHPPWVHASSCCADVEFFVHPLGSLVSRHIHTPDDQLYAVGVHTARTPITIVGTRCWMQAGRYTGHELTLLKTESLQDNELKKRRRNLSLEYMVSDVGRKWGCSTKLPTASDVI